MTCNLFSTRSKRIKIVVVRVAQSTLAKSKQRADRAPEPHTFFHSSFGQVGPRTGAASGLRVSRAVGGVIGRR